MVAWARGVKGEFHIGKPCRWYLIQTWISSPSEDITSRNPKKPGHEDRVIRRRKGEE